MKRGTVGVMTAQKCSDAQDMGPLTNGVTVYPEILLHFRCEMSIGVITTLAEEALVRRPSNPQEL